MRSWSHRHLSFIFTALNQQFWSLNCGLAFKLLKKMLYFSAFVDFGDLLSSTSVVLWWRGNHTSNTMCSPCGI